MNNSIGSHRCSFLFLFLLLSPEILLAVAQPGGNGYSDPNYNRFNPSMAIIIVILVAALFLMGFFSIYIRHCADSPSNSVRALTGGAAGRSRRAARGLDPAVIETFPTLQYSEVKIHKIGKDALECAVCLNEFEETETLRLIPRCNHVFHPECIDEWLGSHTTCPVCRANLVPQLGESLRGVPVLNPDPNPESPDIEAQNDAAGPAYEQQNAHADGVPQEAEELPLNKTLSRNRTRGSMSSRKSRFPRSHTTGHSLVQPGEDTERFTLRLPAEVRKQILNRELHRARSLVVLPREGSSRRGYRSGGEGSSRGRISRRLDRSFKSDRWVFTMAPPFLVRASSIRSPKVSSNAGEGTSTSTLPILPPSAVDSAAPPV